MSDLPTDYQEYIYKSRYSRWLEHEGRRETWPETVLRYINFWRERFPQYHKELYEAENAIYNLEVMPSMRCLMTAGKALAKHNIAGYNCSAVAIDHPRAFDEALYILMCGTGLGFSVERQYITHLPIVEAEFHETDTAIVVEDSKIGWASAFRELVSLLYAGKVPKWDVSKVRPAGDRLKTFGGRASGPEPLVDLFKFTIDIFHGAAGRKLNSLECHDIMCKVGEIVVCGGVRRSALISLSNLSDLRMRDAKSGQWWIENPQRSLANNSVAYTEKPSVGVFMDEWKALYTSKSGERGIFNRYAVQAKAEASGRRDQSLVALTNPCGEIALRSAGLCNLTSVVCRPGDYHKELSRKIRIATFLGVLQSTLTDFTYLRPVWKRNAEEERLLGVSLTGILDCQWLRSATTYDELCYLRDEALSVAEDYANQLGINVPAAVTCVKPEGTVSQLVNSSSGIHPRYAPHYIRTVRADKKDPLAQLMIDQGVPCEDDVLKPDSTYVFSFPQQSPADTVFRDDMTAIEQLELYLKFLENWTEHNPSITVYVREHEWLEVGAWVYKHFDKICGVTFLPHSDHTYKQAPYQEITCEQYWQEIVDVPDKIDWSKLSDYEQSDMTTGNKELACTAGACEL